MSATFTASIVYCAGILDSWLVRGIHQTPVSIAFPFSGIYRLPCLLCYVLDTGWSSGVQEDTEVDCQGVRSLEEELLMPWAERDSGLAEDLRSI